MGVNNKTYILFTLMMFVSYFVSAQTTDRDCIRMGNKNFREGLYNKAEINYRKALDKKNSFEAYYNLGNSLVAMQQDSTAFEMYKNAISMSNPNKNKTSQAYHNMGNQAYANACAMIKGNNPEAGKLFKQAAELYKSALRCNPEDNQTRYNLAKALYMLKKSESEGGGEGENQEENNKEEEKEQENEQNESEEKKQNNEKPKENKNEMSDEVAAQLLNSAQQDEKNVQRKIEQSKNRKRRGLEKDW